MKPKQKQSLPLFAIMSPRNKAVLLGAFFRSPSHGFLNITPRISNVQ